MKVELTGFWGGDISVVNAARVSFNKEVKDMEGKDERLITYLAEHRHDTPFRHNFIQLRCSVPLFLARQLMKHQAGLTWNEVSRRYVDDEPLFHFPTEWRSRPDGSVKQGSGDTHPDSADIDYDYIQSVKSALSVYNYMLEKGVAPEMARMVLPQSMMVDFIWSGNLLAFAHVYNLRAGEGAQQEAREFAELLREAIEPEFEVSWKALTKRVK